MYRKILKLFETKKYREGKFYDSLKLKNIDIYIGKY